MSGNANTTAAINGLAASLRERRTALGMTQEELAEAVGIARPYLSKLENGEATTQVRRLVDVLGALGLELVVLPRQHPVALEHRARRPRSEERSRAGAAADALGRSAGVLADSPELPLLVRELAHQVAEPGSTPVGARPAVVALRNELEHLDLDTIDSRRVVRAVKDAQSSASRLVREHERSTRPAGDA